MLSVRHHLRHYRWLLTGAVSLAVVIGCGDDGGLGKRYPVSGKITYQGKPVPLGNIFFVPVKAEAGRAASGAINSEGWYKLSTAGGEDGAYAGDYKIRIMALESDNTQVLANAPKGGAGKQDDVLKATAAAKKLIPAKYEYEETSELKAKVEEKSNTIDFPLTD